jgi:dTDP-L-rhamnose 4-epimerase
MTKKNILITGGAGFVGSHLSDALLARGHFVRALDNLAPHVHGTDRKRPAYLDSRVELIVGDVRDGAAVDRALSGIDAVFHFAAVGGVDQSMYQAERYTSVNNLGTAVIMDRLVRKPVERLVIASSMSVYGEGLYRDPSGMVREVPCRTVEQLRRSEWDPRVNGQRLTPAPTPETKSVKLESVYALSKYDQERMCLALGRTYGIPTVVLRLFNVYGTRLSPSNPYAGVPIVFASCLLEGRRPIVYEDGEQRRDFVSVHDVVASCLLALKSDAVPGAILNVGSGEPRTVAQVAKKLAYLVGKRHLLPEITGQYRVSDVRHCYADIRRAESVLGYRPMIDLDTGLAELVRWLDAEAGKSRSPVEVAGERRAPKSTFSNTHESVSTAFSELEGSHVH